MTNSKNEDVHSIMIQCKLQRAGTINETVNYLMDFFNSLNLQEL